MAFKTMKVLDCQSFDRSYRNSNVKAFYDLGLVNGNDGCVSLIPSEWEEEFEDDCSDEQSQAQRWILEQVRKAIGEKFDPEEEILIRVQW